MFQTKQSRRETVWFVTSATGGAELGIGAKSGLGDVKEGERDPRTGRVVLDPLKIPTAAQGGAMLSASSAHRTFEFLV